MKINLQTGFKYAFTALLATAVIAALFLHNPISCLKHGDWFVLGLTILVMTCIIAIAAINWPFFSALQAPSRSWALALFLSCLFVVYSLASLNNTMGLKNYFISRYGDAAAYSIQAKMLLKGLVRVPVAQPAEFFSTTHCVNDGHSYFGKYPPGWPSVLAIGIFLGIPWIINTLLVVAGLFVLFQLGRKLYDENIAWIALLFASFSLVTAWSAIGFFSEPLAMLATGVFVYCMIMALENGKNNWSIGAGAALGILLITRPQAAFTIALPMAVLWLWNIFRGKRRIKEAVVIGIAFLPFCALLFAYNNSLTGSGLHFPYALYNIHDRLGFGLRARDIGEPPVYFGIQSFLRNFPKELCLISVKTIPLCYFLLAALLASRKKRPYDGFILWTAGFVTIFYGFFFVWMSSPRYHFPALFVLALGSARGLDVVCDNIFSRRARIDSSRLAFAGAVLFAAYALATLFSVEISRRKQQRLIADPLITIERSGLTNAIVFIRSLPAVTGLDVAITPRLYTQNAPDFNVPVLIALDLGPKDPELAGNYPGRTCYAYEYDSLEGRGRLFPLPLERSGP